MAETGVKMTSTSTSYNPKYLQIIKAEESSYWYADKIGCKYRIINEQPSGKYTGWVEVDNPDSMYIHFVRNGDYNKICGHCGGDV